MYEQFYTYSSWPKDLLRHQPTHQGSMCLHMIHPSYYTLLTTSFLLHPFFENAMETKIPQRCVGRAQWVRQWAGPGEPSWRLIGSPSCKQPRSHKCFLYGPLMSLDSVTSSTPSTTQSPMMTRQKVWRPRPKLQVCLTWWNHVGAINVPYHSYFQQNTGIS